MSSSAIGFGTKSRDPRTYVQQVPLPGHSSHVGVQILTRNAFEYQSSVPTHEQKWRTNFHRRLVQVNEKGFRSPIWKPYRPVEDPIYLDEQQMVCETLGLNQIQENEQVKHEQEPSSATNTTFSASQVKTSLYDKHHPDGLKDVRNEVKKSETLGKFIMVGQSYFKVLEKEEQAKKDKLQADKEKEELRKKEEVLPPKLHDSSDEENVFDANGHIIRASVRPRPFTARTENVLVTQPKQCSLEHAMPIFRQLCAINWLLEMIYQEGSSHGSAIDSKTAPSAIRRITTAWNFKYWGSSVISPDDSDSVSISKHSWDRFVTLKQSVVNNPFADNGSVTNSRQSQKQSTERSHEVEEDFLAALEGNSVHLLQREKSMGAIQSAKGVSQKKNIHELVRPIIEELDKPVMTYQENKELKMARLSATSRPKSSPIRLGRSDLFTPRWSGFVEESRGSFKEVDKRVTITTQGRLETMEKNRLNVCHEKYDNIITDAPPHDALRNMRRKGNYEVLYAREMRKRRKANLFTQWYLDLINTLGPSVCKLWFIEQMLAKVREFALLQGDRKCSPLSFVQTLSRLQDWEICSPDVSAAVEFLREKVVVMRQEEFCQWFHEHYPHLEWNVPNWVGKKAQPSSGRFFNPIQFASVAVRWKKGPVVSLRRETIQK